MRWLISSKRNQQSAECGRKAFYLFSKENLVQLNHNVFIDLPSIQARNFSARQSAPQDHGENPAFRRDRKHGTSCFICGSIRIGKIAKRHCGTPEFMKIAEIDLLVL